LALQVGETKLNRDVAVARAKLRRWIEQTEPISLCKEGVPQSEPGRQPAPGRNAIASHPELPRCLGRVGEASAELKRPSPKKDSRTGGVEFGLQQSRTNQSAIW